MTIVSLEDDLFVNSSSVGSGNLNIKPKTIRFDRTGKEHPVKFFTDRVLEKSRGDSSKIKIAWLIEPPEVEPMPYELIKNIKTSKYFDFILTHNQNLIDYMPNCIYYPFGGTWIDERNWKIHKKQKNVSIIASNKRTTKGHKLRHSIISRYNESIESILGLGYKPIDHKLDGLRDYRYSIVVENSRCNYYFTEKIIDCFLTGTVPIYWGCPGIGEFFNIEGIITFNDIDDLNSILSNLGTEDYSKRFNAVKENMEIAKKYSIAEDYIGNFVMPKIMSLLK